MISRVSALRLRPRRPGTGISTETSHSTSLSHRVGPAPGQWAAAAAAAAEPPVTPGLGHRGPGAETGPPPGPSLALRLIMHDSDH